MFRWAVATVMSRQNKIPSSNGSDSVLALVPLWDLINHEQGPMTSFYASDRNLLVYPAMRNFAEGEEVRHNPFEPSVGLLPSPCITMVRPC